MGVNDARDGIVIYVSVSSNDAFDTCDAFFFGFVGEHRARDDIAYGVNIFLTRGEVIVHDDLSALV